MHLLRNFTVMLVAYCCHRYDPLINCLGINRYVKDYYKPGKDFWTNQSISMSRGGKGSHKGSHVTAAAAKTASFYKNSSTVDAVRHMYADDLLFCSPHSIAQGWGAAEP